MCIFSWGFILCTTLSMPSVAHPQRRIRHKMSFLGDSSNASFDTLHQSMYVNRLRRHARLPPPIDSLCTNSFAVHFPPNSHACTMKNRALARSVKSSTHHSYLNFRSRMYDVFLHHPHGTATRSIVVSSSPPCYGFFLPSPQLGLVDAMVHHDVFCLLVAWPSHVVVHTSFHPMVVDVDVVVDGDGE